VVLVLVSTLLHHSLLKLPLEEKLTLVTISSTIVTMELHDLRLGLGMGLLTWFFHRFLLTRLLTLSPKEHFPQSAYEFDGLLEIICGVREYGWIWICVEFI
jgi:hypothetical protein